MCDGLKGLRRGWAGLLLLAAPTVWALDPGDPAPSLTGLTNWVQAAWVVPTTGAPPAAITVLEFWEPGVPPCRETEPFISKLEKEFRARGMRVAGVTRAEEKDVTAFLKANAITHPVVRDPDGVFSKPWLEKTTGMPRAFVVDAQGKLAWTGHPLEGLDEVVRGLLDGTYDAARTKAAQGLEQSLLDASSAGDLTRALRTVDQLLELFPRRMEYYQLKAGVLFESGDLKALNAHYARMFEMFRDVPEHLNTLAWMIAGPSAVPYAARDLRLALEAARRADELAEHKDAAVLDTLATVYQQIGKLDEALAAAEEAIKRAPDGASRTDYAASRDHIRELIALRDGKPVPEKSKESAKPEPPAKTAESVKSEPANP